HVLDRVAHAFTPDARALDAAVRHVVDAEARDVADDDTADLELVPRGEGVRETAREDAGLQAVLAVVHAAERIVEIGEALEQHDRAKRLLRVQGLFARNVLDDGSLEHRSLAPATGEDASATTDRLRDPSLEAGRGGLVDHRPEER